MRILPDTLFGALKIAAADFLKDHAPTDVKNLRIKKYLHAASTRYSVKFNSEDENDFIFFAADDSAKKAKLILYLKPTAQHADLFERIYDEYFPLFDSRTDEPIFGLIFNTTPHKFIRMQYEDDLLK